MTEEIRDGSADLWIAFPQDFLEQIEVYKTGDEIPQIKVYYNPSEEYSQAAYEGVAGGCLEVYRQALLSERVGDMQSLTVFTVNSDNPDMVIQDEQKAGGKALGMMLPYFVTILLLREQWDLEPIWWQVKKSVVTMAEYAGSADQKKLDAYSERYLR